MRAARFAAVFAALALAAGAVSAVSGAATTPVHVCRGTFKAPGILAGTIRSDVLIRGYCFVRHGSATVRGTLTIARGAVFVASYAFNDLTPGRGVSNLAVTGSVEVESNATALLGCIAVQFTCLDDHTSPSRYSNHVTIGGSLVSVGALAVVVHSASVGNSVSFATGGGGVTCTVPPIFTQLQEPAYYALEDSHVARGVSITGLRGCWLGVLRVHIGRSFALSNDRMSDPDAIEIGANVIAGDLTCTRDSHVWDSSDIGQALYPRQLQRNTVHGRRSGQCVRSSPTQKGQAGGQYPF